MSKKTNKLPFILFLPVSLGIALIVSGIVMEDRDDLFFAGFCVLFGGSFMVAIIVTLLTLALSDKAKTPAEQSDQPSATDVLKEAQRRVDEKTGTSTETREALDRIADSVQKRKRKDAVAKFFVILFVLSFIGCAFTGVGLMANELFVAGGIVFGCAPLMIVTMLVVVKIKEHISLSDSKKSAENYDRKVGRVTRCTVSSTVSTPTRTTTTYKVEFEVDGKDYTAYSRESYDRGDKLDVAVKRNGKSAKIIGRSEYSFIRDRSTPVKADDRDVHNNAAAAVETPKPQDDEAEKYMAAIIGSIDRMRGASEIEDNDEDEERAAREAAHQAVIDELNKLKATRAQAEAKRKERMKKPETEKPPEELTAPEETAAPEITVTEPFPAPFVAPAAATEESAAPLVTPAAPPEEEAQRPRPASPHERRAPVGYKGINRKK